VEATGSAPTKRDRRACRPAASSTVYTGRDPQGNRTKTTLAQIAADPSGRHSPTTSTVVTAHCSDALGSAPLRPARGQCGSSVHLAAKELSHKNQQFAAT